MVSKSDNNNSSNKTKSSWIGPARIVYHMECDTTTTCCRDHNETETRRKCCTDRCNSIENYSSLGPSKVSCRLYYFTNIIPVFCYSLIVVCFVAAALVFFLRMYIIDKSLGWEPVKI